MTQPTPYSLLVAVSETAHLEAWLNLAGRMLPENGQIHLRGMVTIPESQSLSEGATLAQQLRDRFESCMTGYPLVRQEQWIRVDYQPLNRILDEMAESPVDLLLVEWNGPTDLTGGMDTDAILKHAPCDVCLLSQNAWDKDGPVLLALRGGPNLTLGVRLAKALAASSTISLYHVASAGEQGSAELQALIESDPALARAVTARSDDISAGILSEAVGHKAIVIGATFLKPDIGAISGTLIRQLVERTTLPVGLVRAAQPEELAFHAPRYMTQTQETISTRVDRWFAENTFKSDEFADLATLVRLKEGQGVTISLALPAYNEEENVANVISTMKAALMDSVPLLDEIVVIDGGSTDNTNAAAAACGVPVFYLPELLHDEVGFVAGKGEALWKSLYVTSGDIVAWIDTDISNIHPRFVYGILGPLLRHPHIQYVKGFYQRPIKVGENLQAYGGGRVTELVARPLLNLFYPELSGIIQPLSGEYAGRRAALESVPFFSGYGVETGLLIDLLDRHGLNSIAQTDLEKRVHHNQSLTGLSKMSFAILQVFISRLERRYGALLLDQANRSMKMIVQTPERFGLETVQIGDAERPPMLDVPAYRQKHGHN